MLIDLIFRCSNSVLNFSFLNDLLRNAKDVRFDFPEIDFSEGFDEILRIIDSNNYVDLAISTDYLNLREKILTRFFINLGRDNDKIEVLFFFDLVDLKESTAKKNLDYLKSWAEEFQRTYNFHYFICQIDNANEDELYHTLRQ